MVWGSFFQSVFIIKLIQDHLSSKFEICFHAKCLLSISGCGHCKKAKPEYTGAAEKFKDDNKVSGIGS